eukprot:1191745-Prorocentrum_minimum.AAC.5
MYTQKHFACATSRLLKSHTRARAPNSVSRSHIRFPRYLSTPHTTSALAQSGYMPPLTHYTSSFTSLGARAPHATLTPLRPDCPPPALPPVFGTTGARARKSCGLCVSKAKRTRKTARVFLEIRWRCRKSHRRAPVPRHRTAAPIKLTRHPQADPQHPGGQAARDQVPDRVRRGEHPHGGVRGRVGGPRPDGVSRRGRHGRHGPFHGREPRGRRNAGDGHHDRGLRGEAIHPALARRVICGCDPTLAGSRLRRLELA